MQTCLIINDSEKTTLKKSQRILAKYLVQIGPTTYIASLSLEAQEALQSELKAIRSRYLAVVCYVLQKNVMQEIAWHVGSTKNFDAELGIYAHRRRTVKPELPYVAGTWLAQLLAKVLKLSALVHDIGKMSDAFQDKLWRSVGRSQSAKRGEFIRHEALSYYVLRKLGSLSDYQRLTELDGDGLQALVACSSADGLKKDFERFLTQDFATMEAALVAAKSTVGLHHLVGVLVAYLALTHHRLPGAKRHPKPYTYQASKSPNEHFNDNLSDIYAQSLSFSKGNQYNTAAPQSLAPSYRAAVTDLIEHLKAAPADVDTAALVRLAMKFGRPLLVLGDHLGSSLKSDKGIQHSDGILIANTEKSKVGTVAGDSYATHISSVTQHVRKQSQLALRMLAGDIAELPKLSLSAQRSIAAKRSSSGKFKWQSDAFTHLKEKTAAMPTLCLVTAETGSGKTIASAQIAQALNSQRFTYLLGMRSLTLQTGDSYQKDLGLGPADLAVVIGDRIAKKSFEAFGSESLDATELIAHGGTASSDWLDAVQTGKGPHIREAYSEKVLKFLSTPVVISTIDQMIGITKLRNVSKAKEYARAYTSDLILDELDNYSPEELKHVVRLCYYAGLGGRHLICLSATLGPVHAQGVVQAYRQGLMDNRSLVGSGNTFRLACISNLQAPASLECDLNASTTTSTLASCHQFIVDYNRKTIAAQATSKGKLVHQILSDSALAFKPITAEVLQLHTYNSFKVDNRQVSVGFVRYNEVKHARAYARYLMEQAELPEEFEVCVLCYHSKNSALGLWASDSVLNKLTNRKNLSCGEDLSPEAIEKFVTPLAKQTQAKNLVFVVVTTSLLETGRDHDYDWAILECNSHRSLIQACGRVRRHREWLDTARNVSIILHPAKVLHGPELTPVPKNPLNVFAYPGILTSLHFTAGKEYLDDCADAYGELVNMAKAALGNETAQADYHHDSSAIGLLHHAYPNGIRSGIALSSPQELDNALALLEQFAVHKALSDPRSSKSKTYVQTSELAAEQAILTNWAYLKSFREEDDEGPAFYQGIPPLKARTDKFIATASPVSEEGDPPASFIHEQLKLKHAHRDLLSLGLPRSMSPIQAAADAHAEKGFTLAELWQMTRYAPPAYNTSKKLHWSAQLGYCHTGLKNLL